jgi:hypothetical protein
MGPVTLHPKQLKATFVPIKITRSIIWQGIDDFENGYEM